MLARRCLRQFAWLGTAAAAMIAGCASDDQIRGAINDVNHDFRIQYERILKETGTRAYKVRPAVAFDAVQGALSRIGMRVVDHAPDIGYLSVMGPAPMPLDLLEWKKAAEQDQPRLRALTSAHVGVLSWFIAFEPEGLEVVINATSVEVPEGTEVSLTMRMRETKPPRSGIPRREYPPPSAVRMGLEKIWGEVDRDLGRTRVTR